MRTKKLIMVAVIVILSLAALLVSCGGGGGGDFSPGVQPHAAALPVSGSPIGISQSIVVTFDKSMDITTLAIGGTTGTVVSSWSTTVQSNDTLTIAPQSTWTAGWSKILTIDVQDADGLALSPLTLTYDVLSAPTLAYYYVNGTTGDDGGNDGLSPARPKKTITAAITAAGSGSAVLVAEGTYLVNSDPSVNTKIVLKEGVSLYGGYSPDFSVRNRQAHVVGVTDQSTAAGSDNTAIYAGEGVTAAVVVDGFTVTGGGGSVSSAIRTVYSSPVIRNNICSGGTGTNTYAIWSLGYNPLIQHNTISGGSAGSNSYGIYATEGSALVIEKNIIDGGSAGNNAFGITTSGGGVIRNNTVNGGAGQHSAFGISVSGTFKVQNNTVDGGSGVYYSRGIYSLSNAVEIENNIVFASHGIYRICIDEGNSTSPSKLHNNDLFDCTTALYANYFGPGGNCPFSTDMNCLTTIAEVNALSDISGGSSSNISADPVFADQAGGDWHLSSSTPTSVTQGGLDLSTSFTDDKDGNTRTIPWSIGAYEQ